MSKNPLSEFKSAFNPGALLLGLLFALLLSFGLAACSERVKESTGLVTEGKADLRDFDFNSRSSVRLSGDWYFWKDALLSPKEVRERLKETNLQYFKVPGDWSKLGIFSPVEYLSKTGTLALEITLPQSKQEWALRVPDAQSACKLYIDDFLEVSIGQVSETAESYVPGKFLAYPIFHAAEDKILLVLQVANYALPLTGTWDSPLLGSPEAIQKKRQHDTLLTSLISGAMLFMGLYHILLFLLRRKDKGVLVFGLICIFMAFRNLIMGERLLMDLFPISFAGWHLAFIVEHLSVHLCLGLFFLFFYLAFPQELPRWSLYLVGAVCIAWAVLEIFTPPIIGHRFLSAFEYFVGLGSLYLVFINLKALFHRREGSLIIFLGLILLTLTVLNDILLSNGIIESMYMASLGMFLFTFAQSFFLSRRNANLFEQIEKYNLDLAKLNHSLDRFIPHEIFDLLNKKSLTDIQLGNCLEAKMTVFFLDLRGFTSRSETMSPEETFRFLNSFLEQFGPLVRKFGGFIDKYLGDGFMALFPEAADNALWAALSMRDHLKNFNSQLQEQGKAPLSFGIGINTGPLMLGTLGENLRMDTSAISNTVNTASRLEQMNKKFQTDILFSEDTRLALNSPQSFTCIKLSETVLEGKSEQILLYTLQAASSV